MADERGGTKFAQLITEIDLDRTKYDKKLDETVAAANTATLKIEKAFTGLGIRTDESYQKQKAAITTFYKKISEDATLSANERANAEAMLAKKIEALNARQYSGLASMRAAEKKSIEDLRAAEDTRWKMFGTRSDAAINEQKQKLMKNYDILRAGAEGNSAELIRLEQAKNHQLKALNNEMVGHHEMSMASMTRAVLRFYAAYYIASQAIGTIGRLFMGGVEAIDKMQLSAVTVAATITNLQGTTGDVAENYKKNLEYAKGLVPVLMQIDAASLANLDQVQRINNAMAMHGVILDSNNKKQITSMTALTNAIAMFTVGQNQEQQAAQETNALLNGEVTTRNRIAMMIDQMIKRQGDYKDGLKGLNTEAAKHGDWLERISPYLVGIAAASGDISKTWESIRTSIQTTWMILQTEIFANFYKGLVTAGQEAVGWAREHAEEIGRFFVIAMNAVGNVIKSTLGLLSGFAPILKDIQPLVSAIAYGWGGVLASLSVTGEFLGNTIALIYQMGKALVQVTMAGAAALTGNKDLMKVYWDEAKKNWADVEKLAARNKFLMTDGITDAIVEYDKLYDAKKKAGVSGIIPAVPPGGESEEVIKKREAAEKQITEAIRKNVYERDAIGKDAYEKEVIRINQEVEKYRDAKVNELLITKYVAGEMAIIEAKRNEEIKTATQKNADQLAASWGTYYDNKEKQAKDEAKAIIEYEKDKQKEMEKTLEEWRKAGHAAEDEMMKEIERGVKASKDTLDRLEKNSELFKEAARGIQQGFVTMFEDLFDGGLNSFKKFADSIFNVFKRMLAQMATLAIARPVIVPVVTALGGALGVPEATAGVLGSMGISGPAATGAGGIGDAAGGVAGGAGLSYGLSNIIGSLQSNAGRYAAQGTAYLFGAEAGTVVGQTILDMSTSAFSGWSAGIGTFIVEMLSGSDFKTAAIKGVATGAGAWGGATIGTMILPGVGTFIGAAIGSLIGNFVGGLFTKDKENEFTLTELIQSEINSLNFSATGGFGKVGSSLTGGGDTGAWYNPIANAYSATIETIQQSFNTMVFDFASKLPGEMQAQILDELAATDFGALQSGVSGGKWKLSEAEGVIGDIAKKYAAALATTLGNAYANALGDYINSKGAEGLIGDTSAWGMLTNKVQQNINDMFTGIAATIKGGDLEGGLKAVNEIVTVIGNIGRAMAPISEIIATKDLDEYGLQLYNINKQFDDYATALRSAGVDLEKFTALEEARMVMLRRAALEQAETVLDAARINLRRAFDAEKSRLTDEYNAELEALNTTLGATKEIVRDLQTGLDQLRSVRERMHLIDPVADQIAFTKAQADVASVIANARKGDLSGLRDVQKSVDILAGITPEMYGNSIDYKRDFQKSLNSIVELEGYANKQLVEAQKGQTLEEETVDTLTKTYKEQVAWRDDQMDALLRIDTGMMSVADMIEAGISIESAPIIKTYLDAVSFAIAGNNSAEAIALRDAIEVLRTTTADGLITTAEAEATTAALDVLRTAETTWLQTLNNSVLLIPQAIAVLQLAMERLLAAGGTLPAARTIPINPAINSAYQTLFGRDAETAGASFWSTTGLTGSALTDSIRWGAQGDDLTAMVSRGLGTPTQMAINEAYKGIMGRSADAEGLAFYQGQITSGTKTMDQIMADLTWAKGHGALASGLDYVPHDGPAYIHQGEAVLTTSQADKWRSGDRDNVVSIEEFKALKAEMQKMVKSNERAQKSAEDTSTLLKQVIYGGQSIRTTAV